MKYTPEQIAAAQAALNRKPDDAELAQAPRNVVDGSGHDIARGQIAWRHLGPARYDGPPMAGVSITTRSERWTCQACAARKGWNR